MAYDTDYLLNVVKNTIGYTLPAVCNLIVVRYTLRHVMKKDFIA